MYALFPSKITAVHYCEYKSGASVSAFETLVSSAAPMSWASEETMKCSVAADGFYMANGICHNNKYSKIFAVDWLDKKINVYDMDKESKKLSFEQSMYVSSVVDNIKCDDVTGHIYGATFDSGLKSSPDFKSTKIDPRSTGGAVEI